MIYNFYASVLLSAGLPTEIPEQPLQMIEKYGLSMVLIVVLFMILIFLGKFIIKQFNNKNSIIEKKEKDIEKKDKIISKKQDEILEMSKELILLNQKMEEYFVDNNHQLSGEELTQNSKNTNRVYQILNHLKGKYNFDRVTLYQYHNGGKNINGKDFKKCSATHEVCDLGVDSIKDVHQNRHISSEYLWAQLLYNGGELVFPDTNELKTTDELYADPLKKMDVKSYYSLSVYDYQEKPIAFLVMVSCKDKLKVSQKELTYIKNKLISLGGFIDDQEH